MKPFHLLCICLTFSNCIKVTGVHAITHTNSPVKVYFITDAEKTNLNFIFKLVVSTVYHSITYNLQYICSCELPVFDRKGYCSSLQPFPENVFKNIPEEVVYNTQEYAYLFIDKIIRAKYSVNNAPLDMGIIEIKTDKKYAWNELSK